jgi:hypothetical protein
MNPDQYDVYDATLLAAIRVALTRDQRELAGLLIETTIDTIQVGDRGDYDNLTINLECPTEILDALRPYAAEHKNPETFVMEASALMSLFRDVAQPREWIEAVHLHARLEPPEPNWRDQLRSLIGSGTTNQGRTYGSSKVITHNGFNYRTPAEVAIAKVLEQSEEVLFFPNCAALSGKVQKEPDFLIFYKRRTGILEVDGVSHVGRAADDSLRDSYFQRQGIFIKHYPHEKCLSDPTWVARDFLNLLVKS